MIVDAIINGAIADAYGAHYEGQVGPIDCSEHDRWLITDDTALTLATCESIIAQEKIDPASVSKFFVKYFQAGKIIRTGSSTLKALVELEAGIDHHSSGRKGERAAGNGPAMRISPLYPFVDLDDLQDRRLIKEVCYITHRNEEAYAAAIAVLGSLQNISNDPVNSAINVTFDSNTKDKLVELRNKKISISNAAKLTGTSGYSAESVPLAIYAASVGCELGFKQTILELCSAGGDTDTISSIAAQILGANGIAAPVDWRNKLPDKELIEEISSKLFALCS